MLYIPVEPEHSVPIRHLKMSVITNTLLDLWAKERFFWCEQGVLFGTETRSKIQLRKQYILYVLMCPGQELQPVLVSLFTPS